MSSGSIIEELPDEVIYEEDIVEDYTIDGDDEATDEVEFDQATKEWVHDIVIKCMVFMEELQHLARHAVYELGDSRAAGRRGCRRVQRCRKRSARILTAVGPARKGYQYTRPGSQG